MVEVLQRLESAPDEYPAAPFSDSPATLSDAALALSSDAIWHRVESYIAHRWTPRAVVWVVQGQGWWRPDLTPVTVSDVAVWNSLSAWESCTLDASPLGGYELPGEGPYRFTGTAGDESPSDVPAAVSEAVRRLAEYLAVDRGRIAGASSESVSIGGGAITQQFDRSPAWVARAFQQSGAADLLRPYRRV